jgi:hypothetical protein
MMQSTTLTNHYLYNHADRSTAIGVTLVQKVGEPSTVCVHGAEGASRPSAWPKAAGWVREGESAHISDKIHLVIHKFSGPLQESPHLEMI